MTMIHGLLPTKGKWVQFLFEGNQDMRGLTHPHLIWDASPVAVSTKSITYGDRFFLLNIQKATIAWEVIPRIWGCIHFRSVPSFWTPGKWTNQDRNKGLLASLYESVSSMMDSGVTFHPTREDLSGWSLSDASWGLDAGTIGVVDGLMGLIGWCFSLKNKDTKFGIHI